MNGAFDLVLRQVQLPDGRIADVGIGEGRFQRIAKNLPPSDQDMDCTGQRLLSGLHDHHIHLLATAARMQSVDLSHCANSEAIVAALRSKAAASGSGAWIRATGYDERVAGIPDRSQLDQWLPSHPLRIQDRTGALWLLNSAALRTLDEGPWPECVETDAAGNPTGRIWRGDDWLRQQLGNPPPPLAALSRQLAKWGVTAVTDAGAQNGPEEAALFSAACDSGALCQRLTVMGRETLSAGSSYTLGPVKLLFDERALPELDSIATRITAARNLGRAVAAHCVTEGELVTYLAALEQAGGARPGDRIEHGSMIAEGLIAEIARLQLTVVANPGFIAHRGDRYLEQIDATELPALQRMASLSAAGAALRAGSDAPYGPANPWTCIRAAMLRQTESGVVLGAGEALGEEAALALFAGEGRIEEGAVADCCVIAGDWAAKLRNDGTTNPVQMTLIGGQIV